MGVSPVRLRGVSPLVATMGRAKMALRRMGKMPMPLVRGHQFFGPMQYSVNSPR